VELLLDVSVRMMKTPRSYEFTNIEMQCVNYATDRLTVGCTALYIERKV
jgi:hypothetical protein